MFHKKNINQKLSCYPQYPYYSLIGRININSLRNKITDLKVIIKTLSLDYVILSKFKTDQSFPTAQFNVEVHEIRASRDWDKYGGGLIGFVRRGLYCKRLRDYELKHSESLCSELTFISKKWICFSISKSLDSSNPSMFFQKLTISLGKALLKYENRLIMGHVNIDVKSQSLGLLEYENVLIMGNFNIVVKSQSLGYDKRDEFVTYLISQIW